MSETVSPRQASFSLWLDVFRWMAAAAVLVTHTGNRLLTKVQVLPEAERMLVHVGYQFAAGFAHQAVMVFFVISGFLVGGSVWAEFVRRRDVDMAQFMTKRLLRLCVVLFPVFVIGGLLDATGALVLGGANRGIYHPELLDRLSPQVLACNAVFLQNFECWQFGSNGALWSLAHEFWYYLLWPMFLSALFSRRPLRLRILLMVLLAVAGVYFSKAPFTTWPLLPYMLIWLLGVWASACKRPVIGNVVIATILFVVALVAIRIFVRMEMLVGLTAFVLDVGIGFLFANLIVAMRGAPKLRMPPGRHIHRRLAEFSFSLYCLHTPVLMAYSAALTAAIGTGSHIAPRGLGDWAIVAGGLALSIVLSYLLSLVTECRTNALRRWMFDRVGWSGAAEDARPGHKLTVQETAGRKVAGPCVVS